MAAHKKWTENEDKVILRFVKESPENLSEAFKKASENLDNRTPASCSYRWYSHISRDANKASTCFVTLSKTKYGRNRKNCKDPYPIHTTNSLWTKIKKFLFK